MTEIIISDAVETDFDSIIMLNAVAVEQTNHLDLENQDSRWFHEQNSTL